jgi:hypothetical protein
MANLVLAFGEILAGAVVLDAAIKGDSIANVIRGTATQQGLGGGSSTSIGGGSTTGGGTTSTGSSSATGSSGATTNPFPGGWVPSRADMGYDGTFTGNLVAPASGTITYASRSFSNWGGYLQLKLDNAIPGLASQTLYFAEGLFPTVKAGQHVAAGQAIATAGTVGAQAGVPGNIEWGLAVNPTSIGTPTNPVAESGISNPAGVVRQFLSWAENTLGVKPPNSTTTIGYP